MSKFKNILIWTLAIVLMLTIAIYQRLTGPTYPQRGTVTIANETINFKLPRSHDGSGTDLIKIKVNNQQVIGFIKLKRFKSYDEWSTQQLKRAGNFLYASIPEQPPAGKVMYQIALIDAKGNAISLTEEPVIIRFKGAVPKFVLFPHIFAMFFAMVFSIRAGFEYLFKGPNTYKISLWTLILLTIGGMILGPTVQHYAFGAFWTGWPFGHDLTDNKTLIAFIGWIFAVYKLRRNPYKTYWALIASIILLAVYLVPHSVLGSEIDYTKLPQ